MARFDIETRETKPADGPNFAVFTSWLRDNKTKKAYSFTHHTRDGAREQAIEAGRELHRKTRMEFSFVCGS